MKTKQLIPLIFISLFFLNCEKIIEPGDLPQQDPRLVVNCIIYNDSVVRASVSSSKSILSGKDYVLIDNAVCDLYEDDKFVERLANVKSGNYEGATHAATNKKYTLKVTAPGYNGVEGSTVLGENVVLSYAERYDTANSNFREYSYDGITKQVGGTVNYKLRIRDNINVKNYYSLQSILYILDSTGQVKTFVDSYISDNSTGASTGYFYSNTADIDDATLVNSNEVPVDISININSNYMSGQSYHSVEVFLIISNISEDLYKYKKTLNDQASAGVSFFAEPVLVHSNITNGMGIMGSINSNPVFLSTCSIAKQ